MFYLYQLGPAFNNRNPIECRSRYCHFGLKID